MTKITYDNIYVNATFAGPEGSFTMTPERIIPGPIEITSENSYVTEIVWNGWTFKHQNSIGANIHGGNHTTEDWFTFDIGQFYLMNPNNTMNFDIPLTSKPNWNNVNIITVDCPPVPCFLKGTPILKSNGEYVHVEKLKVGDYVATLTGPKKILWVGNCTVKVTEKTIPYYYCGVFLSPQHRMLIAGKGLQAIKHRPGSVTAAIYEYVDYYHFLLEEHSIVFANGILVESLWPGKETIKMLGDAFKTLIDIEEYCKNPAAPFLNKHGEAKK